MKNQRTPSVEAVQAHYAELSSTYNHLANQTCETRYFETIAKFLKGSQDVLEVGAGSSNMIDRLNCRRKVACDLSKEMLAKRTDPKVECVQADATKLPFKAQTFDAVFSVNLLEHVEDASKVITEASRVLRAEGIFLSITPNGSWEWLLDFAERFKLKLPEGPHRFLTPNELRQVVTQGFEVIAQGTFLTLPMGNSSFSAVVDRLVSAHSWNAGFFQFVVGKNRSVSAKRGSQE